MRDEAIALHLFLFLLKQHNNNVKILQKLLVNKLVADSRKLFFIDS